MRTIYLVRHAKPDMQGKRIYLGQKDIPLAKEGEEQAEQLAAFFIKHRPDAIFTSTLIRCKSTAKIIAGKAGLNEIPFIEEPGLMEMDLGLWDGLSFEEIKRLYPEEYIKRGSSIGRYITPGGESYEQAGERFSKAFFGAVSVSEGDLLIVAHSGVIRAFLCRVEGLDIDRLTDFDIPYASVTGLGLDSDALKNLNENDRPESALCLLFAGRCADRL